MVSLWQTGFTGYLRGYLSTIVFLIVCSMSKVFVCVAAIERPEVEG